MTVIPQDIEDYCLQHSSETDALLKKIYRDTYADVLMPRMISGPLQGTLLSFLSKMIKPKYVLEIGTFTGYSALCLATGLQREGKIITIDINEELEKRVRQYFQQSPFAHCIEYVIADALDYIPKINLPLDLVFIDADKINYARYFDLVIDKVIKGGWIIADNVLWSGKVLPNNATKPDKDTKALIEFNSKIKQDLRVEKLMLPIRDGITIMRKI
ncbi:MAG: O-methyltransferase [Cytophagaceae bacterium]|nr:O-methyltransferase [Cytophagaceae bacterium]MDW8455719.1 O-methyltransferase [Cytophagaceae bacterium]